MRRAATAAILFSYLAVFSCSGKSPDLGKAPAPWLRLDAPRVWKIPNRLPWRLYADLRGSYPDEYLEMRVLINGALHSTAAIDPGRARVYQLPLFWNVEFYRAMQVAFPSFDGEIDVTVSVYTLDGRSIARSTRKVRIICLTCLGV